MHAFTQWSQAVGEKQRAVPKILFADMPDCFWILSWAYFPSLCSLKCISYDHVSKQWPYKQRVLLTASHTEIVTEFQFQSVLILLPGSLLTLKQGSSVKKFVNMILSTFRL